MDMNVLLGLWSAVCAGYLGVSVLRWNAAQKEDDHLHVLDSEKELVGAQMSVAQKLDALDRWKFALLLATLLLGFALAALHLYSVWQRNSSLSY